MQDFMMEIPKKSVLYSNIVRFFVSKNAQLSDNFVNTITSITSKYVIYSCFTVY